MLADCTMILGIRYDDGGMDYWQQYWSAVADTRQIIQQQESLGGFSDTPPWAMRDSIGIGYISK